MTKYLEQSEGAGGDSRISGKASCLAGGFLPTACGRHLRTDIGCYRPRDAVMIGKPRPLEHGGVGGVPPRVYFEIRANVPACWLGCLVPVVLSESVPTGAAGSELPSIRFARTVPMVPYGNTSGTKSPAEGSCGKRSNDRSPAAPLLCHSDGGSFCQNRVRFLTEAPHERSGRCGASAVVTAGSDRSPATNSAVISRAHISHPKNVAAEIPCSP